MSYASVGKGVLDMLRQGAVMGGGAAAASSVIGGLLGRGGAARNTPGGGTAVRGVGIPVEDFNSFAQRMQKLNVYRALMGLPMYNIQETYKSLIQERQKQLELLGERDRELEATKSTGQILNTAIEKMLTRPNLGQDRTTEALARPY